MRAMIRMFSTTYIESVISTPIIANGDSGVPIT